MQHQHLQFGHGFRVVLGDQHSQAAQMTLAAGENEGGPDNHHGGSDQSVKAASRRLRRHSLLKSIVAVRRQEYITSVKLRYQPAVLECLTEQEKGVAGA